MDTVKGRWALVTGATGGLGQAFCRLLAGLGANLVLVARQQEVLDRLAADLAADAGIQAEPLAADLAEADQRTRLHQAIAAKDIAVDLLVNNAGFGLHGPFVQADVATTLKMVELDVAAVVHLSRLFAADMVARGRGYLLQVASTAAFQPDPGYAVYGAAKSFVLSFGHALNHELKGTGVSCTVFCPGPTATGFFSTAGHRLQPPVSWMLMQPAVVARIGLAAALRRRPQAVAGWHNAIGAAAVRFVPRTWAAAVGGWILGWRKTGH